MEASTPREFLEEILPQKFNPDKAEGITAVIQLHISGEDGGDWVLTIRDRKLEVREGTVEGPHITLMMKDRDYLKLVNGKLSGQKAFMSGKLRFKGDMNLGMKLQGLGLI